MLFKILQFATSILLGEGILSVGALNDFSYEKGKTICSVLVINCIFFISKDIKMKSNYLRITCHIYAIFLSKIKCIYIYLFYYYLSLLQNSIYDNLV